MRRRILILFFLLLAVANGREHDLQKVSIQLKWFKSFQFAGYYMALHKGFYKDVGLDVTIKERDPKKNNIEQVIEGDSEYGVSDSAILLYRAKKHPVKLLASIFQHSPLIFISHKDSGIVSPFELKGKKISYQKGLDDAPLEAMMQFAGIGTESFTYKPLDFSGKAFKERKVDVMSAYLSNQPYVFKQQGIDVNIINPHSYGIDFYGDNLFTTESEINNHPERAKAFLEASLRGWNYALEYQDETVDVLMNVYKVGQTRSTIKYAAQTLKKLILPDVITLGYTNKNRFFRIADIYHQTKKYHTQELYDAVETLIHDFSREKTSDLSVFVTVLFILLVVVSLTFLFVYLDKLRVKRRVKELTQEVLDQNKMIDKHIMICQTDENGVISYVNQAYCDTSGYTSDELIGKTHKILRCKQTHSSIYKQMWDALESGSSWEGELSNTSKQGEIYYVHIYIEPTYKDGVLKGYKSIQHNISDKVTIEAVKEQMIDAQNIVHMGNWTFNHDLNVLYWSDEIYNIFDIEDKSIKPSYDLFISFIHEEDKSNVINILNHALKDRTVYEIKHRVITRNGNIKYVIGRGKTIYDGDGNPLTTNGTLQDITKEHQLQLDLADARDRAEQISQYKSQFLANMSHEIRTPLNGIIGLTSLVLKSDLNSKQKEYLEKVEISSQTLLHVINDILDYSKIEAGKLDLENKIFSLSKVIRSVEDLFAVSATSKGVALNVEIKPRSDIVVVGDQHRLTQILNNLLSNALKFTPYGSVELTCEIIDDLEDAYRFEFRIKDSGIGMTKEQSEKLFQPFAQADASTTREYGGTGLGLVITKQLVELMHGRIWVHSQLDEGSEFIFNILLQKTHEELVEQKQLGMVHKFSAKKILIAEDNKTNQLVISGMLEEYPFELTFANNGQEAVERVDDTFDLVLMDIHMPVLDGYEASRQILEKYPDISIIALTANVMEQDIKKALECGMKAHIPKPLTADNLMTVLKKHLEK